eukprot:gb/GFBE01083230.1/.p1 GENE.gb/GFBE01083230.1/~~gb/GFBE01083230.1/.p1  ORF type:complete len:327 (+),score=61.16 gb/GFBE01083230.1/:1-981(+)
MTGHTVPFHMMFLLSTLHLFGVGASHVAEQVPELHEIPGMTLLQVSLQAGSAYMTSARTGEDVLPLKWMHIPKTGTSILNALAHLPGVCEGIPEDLTIDEDHFGPHFEVSFMSSVCRQSCPGLDCHHDWRTHHAIGLEYEEYYNGHGVVMFRQPEQRAISFYNYVSIPGGTFYNPSFQKMFPTVRSFAEHAEGCMARQLTENSGQPCAGLVAAAGKVTGHQLALAKKRLREGFVFVGITEQWDLSICLLHAQFGGECSAKEFENIRPGAASSDDGYDTSVLDGFVDEADGEIYQVALDIFSENLAKYNVSHESCRPCWEKASATTP